MLTRAKLRVEKSIEAQQRMSENRVLTKPGPSKSARDKDSPTSQSFSGSKKSGKRKSSEFASPSGIPKKTKKIYSSSSLDSSQASGSCTGAKVLNRIEAEMEEEKDHQFEQMYNWFKSQSASQDGDKRSYSHSRRYRKSRSTSRSRSRKSRSPSRHSDHSRSSRHSSQTSHTSRRSHTYSKSSAIHPISPSPSPSPSRSNYSEVSRERSRSASHPPSSEGDELDKKIEQAVNECAPKPKVGPRISEKVGTLMELYVAKPEFQKVIKLTDKYPRPENVPSLLTPDVTQDVDKTVDHKAIKEDKRLRNDQLCTAATLSSLGGVLDIIRAEKERNPNLIKAGEMVLDCITMVGFVHNDFSSIRLKSFKQTVHPTYGEVFTSKPDEPEMLMGKTPIGDQVKSLEDLNKLRAKLKKPDPTPVAHKPRDFRRRGEYQRNQFRGSRAFIPRRRDDRRRRYSSPKSYHRKNHQDNRNQEEKKQTPRRN